MATLAWVSGFPAIQAPSGIVGVCAYTLAEGETWQNAELVANVPGTQGQYTVGMTKDNPQAGQCAGTIMNVPSGTYDVLGKLWYRDANGMHGKNTPLGQVTVP